MVVKFIFNSSDNSSSESLANFNKLCVTPVRLKTHHFFKNQSNISRFKHTTKKPANILLKNMPMLNWLNLARI